MVEINSNQLKNVGHRVWPVWFCLDEAMKKALSRYQRRHYHAGLNPPDHPADIESLKEIQQLMAEAPDHPAEVR